MRKLGCREMSSAFLGRVAEIFGCSWRWIKKSDLILSFNIRFLSLSVCWWEWYPTEGYEKGYHCRSGDGLTPRGGRTCLHWKVGKCGSFLPVASISQQGMEWGSSARGVEANGGLMTGEEVWIRFFMTTHCIIHTTLSSGRGARKPGPCQDLNQGRTFPVLSVHCTLVGCIRVCFPQWTMNFSKDMEMPLSSLLFLFICNNLSTCPSTSPGRPPL